LVEAVEAVSLEVALEEVEEHQTLLQTMWEQVGTEGYTAVEQGTEDMRIITLGKATRPTIMSIPIRQVMCRKVSLLVALSVSSGALVVAIRQMRQTCNFNFI
jgi:hypothetical protein